MIHVDTIIRAKWVVPMEGKDTFLEDHSVVINHGKIKDIVCTQSLSDKYSANQTHYLDETHVVMPGLINTHTHTPAVMMRGLADDLPLMTWLEKHMWPAEREVLCPEFIQDSTRLGIVEMLRSGTTCFNDMFYFVNDMADVAHEMKMRAVIGETILDLETPWAKSAEIGFELTEGLIRHVADYPLVSASVAPHSPYATNPDIWVEAHRIARQHDISLNMHLHESETEIQTHQDSYDMRPLYHMAKKGLCSSKMIAVHMTQLNKQDIDIVVRYGINVVSCPRSNLKLANGCCPTELLLDAGVNVALGTDSAASNNSLNMFNEINAASLIAKHESHNPASLPAYQALQMATINGAKALGMENDIGSLVKDKQADVIAIDLGDINTQPVYNPISHLAYAVNPRQVSDVWIAGKQLMKHYQLLKVDEQQVLANALKWREKLVKFAKQ